MMDTKVRDALTAAIDAGAAPGIVAAWIGPDGDPHVEAAGVRGLDNSEPMTPDTLFWIASLTKAITTAAALQLVERGILDLDAPVGNLLPELASPRILTGFDASGAPQTRAARNPVTLRHLLGHMSGLGYEFCCADLARYCASAGVSTAGLTLPDVPLVFEPGEGWQYGIGIDWAAQMIERASGKPLAEYFASEIFAPLGMTDSTFFPNAAQNARRASVHARLPDGALAPMPFAMPETPHASMGGGGLYATAGDYLRFLSMILGAGEMRGARLLGPSAFEHMTKSMQRGSNVGAIVSAIPTMSRDFDPFPGVEKSWTAGFVMNPADVAGGRSANSLAWAGLANCYYWADPKRGVAGVFMSQVLPFADPALLDAFARFERAVYETAP